MSARTKDHAVPLAEIRARLVRLELMDCPVDDSDAEFIERALRDTFFGDPLPCDDCDRLVSIEAKYSECLGR